MKKGRDTSGSLYHDYISQEESDSLFCPLRSMVKSPGDFRTIFEIGLFRKLPARLVIQVGINQRLKSTEIRKELTDEWKSKGLKEGSQFATLTDIVTKAWAGYEAFLIQFVYGDCDVFFRALNTKKKYNPTIASTTKQKDGQYSGVFAAIIPL